MSRNFTNSTSKQKKIICISQVSKAWGVLHGSKHIIFEWHNPDIAVQIIWCWWLNVANGIIIALQFLSENFWRVDINTNKTIRSKYPGGRCVTLKLKHQSVIVKSTWSYQRIIRIEIMIKELCISCWLTFLSFICDWCSNALILIIRYKNTDVIVIQKALSSLAAKMHHAITRL